MSATLLLTLDIGNTNPHVGWFLDDELKKVTPLKQLTAESVDAVGARKVISITSKVGGEHDFSWLNPHDLTQWRNLKGFLGMPFKYAGTLGADRLVQIYYLFQTNPIPTVLIDAGTFTTVDLIDESGHLGGVILPGLETYLDIFKMKGARLPRLSREQVDFGKKADLFALNTFDAIASGYQLLMQQIREQVMLFNARRIILTGGHAESLKPLFLEAETQPYLIHHALKMTLLSAQKLGFM